MSRRPTQSPANRPAKLLAALLALAAGATLAQSPAPRQSTAQQTTIFQQTTAPQTTEPQAEPAPPHGKVLFSRSLDDPSAAPQPAAPAPSSGVPQTIAAAQPAGAQQVDPLAVSDAERSALTFTAYDLDVHLAPATAGISVRAGLTVRNDGAAPLTRLTLQISSSLHWEAVSARPILSFPSKLTSTIPTGMLESTGQTASGDSTAPLAFSSRLIHSDADHTGLMSEAVVPLPHPLAPGASLSLDVLYSGAIPPSAQRLERLGAPDNQAQQVDWDSIAPGLSPGTAGVTALRGFGNVLWIPASAAPAFLGDGACLPQRVGVSRLRQSAATIRLRLAVETLGDPPDAAFFCGRRQPLKAISDNSGLPAAQSPGIATAVFEAEPVGFRSPSLFVTDRPASETGTPANPALIAAITDHYDTLPAYASAAALVEPLLADWFGAQPLGPLTLIDHPGQPFEDDALLVRPMRAAAPATLAPVLAHSLTHAWIRSSHAWIDEGLAQFVTLLWIERTGGRAAALDALQNAAQQLVQAELQHSASANDFSSKSSDSSQSQPAPAFTVSPAGESLAAATGDVFFRTKAAAVWWMLRDIVGDDALKQALQIYRQNPALDRDPMGFERVLEKTSHKNLRWFFDDWVYRDRGLPALAIVSVTPSQLTSRAGLPAGWLVAIEVRNDGSAAAEVPVTVRSGSAGQTQIETQRLRIAARSSVSTRIVFASPPERVEVNDGSIPEAETSIHTRQIVLPDPRPAASHPPSR